MSLRYVPLLFLTGLIFLQCKSNLAQSKKSYDSLITATLDNNYIDTPSPSKIRNLYTAKTETAGQEHYNYVVVVPEEKKVMFKGKYNRGGYVRWIDDKTIEQYSVPKHIDHVVDSALYKRRILID
jgi:hypothetical protein